MSDPYATRPTFKYSHQAGAVTNVQIKSGPGILRLVTINTSGATVGAVTLADNTVPNSSNPIAVITPVASTAPMYIEFDIGFNNGLVITGGGSTMDVTVSYI